MVVRFVYAAMLCCLVAWFAACQTETAKDGGEDAIRIGLIYPFSGPNAATGGDLQAGADLAAELVNSSFDLRIPLAKTTGLPGQKGARIKLLYRDSQGDPQTAAEHLEELVNDQGVAAVAGCYSSTVTAAASERAEMLEIPFLNAASTSPLLTRRNFKWFFRTTPDDSMFAQNFFAFLSDLSTQKGIEIPRRLSLVYENRLWGTGVAQAEKRMAQKHDFDVVEDIPYDANGEQFEDELQRVKMSLPGVIMQASYERDAIVFMQGYKRRQINPIAILAMNGGFISPRFLEKLGRDGEFVLSREVWALDIAKRKPLVEEVNELFKERYGRNMTGNSARAFTGLIVLAEAINRARGPEPKQLRDALLDTAITAEQLIMPWEGVVFDSKTGQNTMGRGIIVQVQGGRYRTVWPTELSDQPVIWPMPRWSERGNES
jgi:branched-chain amino acid transport system substrate-binding protein